MSRKGLSARRCKRVYTHCALQSLTEAVAVGAGRLSRRRELHRVLPGPAVSSDVRGLRSMNNKRGQLHGTMPDCGRRGVAVYCSQAERAGTARCGIAAPMQRVAYDVFAEQELPFYLLLPISTELYSRAGVDAKLPPAR